MELMIWTAAVVGCFLMQQAISLILFWTLAGILDWLIASGRFFTKTYACAEFLFYVVGLTAIPAIILLRKRNKRQV